MGLIDPARTAFIAACNAMGAEKEIKTKVTVVRDGACISISDPEAVWNNLPEQQRNIWREAVKAAFWISGLPRVLKALVTHLREQRCVQCFDLCEACDLFKLLEDAKAALQRVGKEAKTNVAQG